MLEQYNTYSCQPLLDPYIAQLQKVAKLWRTVGLKRWSLTKPALEDKFSRANGNSRLAFAVSQYLAQPLDSERRKRSGTAGYLIEAADDHNDYLVYNRKTGVLSYDKDGDGHKHGIAIAQLTDPSPPDRRRFSRDLNETAPPRNRPRMAATSALNNGELIEQVS